jgi:hypothetical protein
MPVVFLFLHPTKIYKALTMILALGSHFEHKDEKRRSLPSRSSWSKWGDKPTVTIPIRSLLQKRLAQRTKGKEGLIWQRKVLQRRTLAS